MMDLDLHFVAELWVYPGAGEIKNASAWYFVTLPGDIADQIKFVRQKQPGFGTIRVKVRIGATQWQTSLFPDKASNGFLLPVKAAVRRKENLVVGDTLNISIVVAV